MVSRAKEKVLKRKLQKYDEDFKKLISSKYFYKICHGDQQVNVVKQLGTTSEEKNSKNYEQPVPLRGARLVDDSSSYQ